MCLTYRHMSKDCKSWSQVTCLAGTKTHMLSPAMYSSWVPLNMALVEPSTASYKWYGISGLALHQYVCPVYSRVAPQIFEHHLGGHPLQKYWQNESSASRCKDDHSVNVGSILSHQHSPVGLAAQNNYFRFCSTAFKMLSMVKF